MNMKKVSDIKGLVLGLAGVLVLVACNGNVRKAEHTAQEFLRAYYTDLDFKKALSLSTDVSHAALHDQEEMVSLNPYAKDEVPDIVFKGLEIDEENEAKATYRYSANRVEKTLPLRKLNGVWLVDLQGGTVEAGGNNSGTMELSSGEQGGFASAVSGIVVYKKRERK